MFSCEDEEEKEFPELLAIKKNYSFKWEKLLFENEKPYIFHDTKLNLEGEKSLICGRITSTLKRMFILINIYKFITNTIKNVYHFF